MMMLTTSRLDPAEEEDKDYLSIARPLAIGVLTFVSLELLVACLLFTHIGQKLMPGHQSTSPHINAIQPSTSHHATHRLPSFQRS
jgi:hypothetical protein